MTEDFKGFTLVKYCVGWNFDGPIYATHFLSKSKPSHNIPKNGEPTVMGWRQVARALKHEHNI